MIGLSFSVTSVMLRLAWSTKARKLLKVSTLRITEAIIAIGPFPNPLQTEALNILPGKTSILCPLLQNFSLLPIELLSKNKSRPSPLKSREQDSPWFRRMASTRTRCGRYNGSYITSAPKL